MGRRAFHRRSPFKMNKKRFSSPSRAAGPPEGYRIHTNKRVKKLNMRRIQDFKWDLSLILKEISDENVASIKGGIYAKASKIGVREARDFVTEKEKEGIIPEETAMKLTKLLQRYSVFR
jgi:hypothetical protein